MRKAYKIIISLSVVLIAGLNFIVPAFAQDPFTAVAVGGLTGYSGAGLFSSMAALSGVDMPWGTNTADDIDAMWDVTNPNHVYFSGTKHEASNTGTDIYDYIQVDIGDWLQAQQEFISNLIDDNNITDNSTGNITGNQTTILGLQATEINSRYYTDPITIPAQAGTYPYGYTEIRVLQNGGLLEFYLVYLQNQIHLYDGRAGCRIRLNQSNISTEANVQYTQDTTWTNAGILYTGTIPQEKEYDVDWESTTVNKNVFNGWDSAKVKIPKSISQLQTGWTLHDFLAELDRIWYGAGEDNIIIEDGGDTPVPPVPIPDTPLGNVPFDDWVDLWGQGIYQQLENQSEALDFIGSSGEDAVEELESINEGIGSLEETAESIDTNIGIGNGILGGIRSLAQEGVDFLEGIAEHVEELVEEIVEGTETLIAGILNQIPQAFGVIFGPIKQASSIWHYVVEWIQSIGTPFQFIWSMASGTSYYIILPVYASLAAAVVLAFFKRFGR